MTLAAPRSRQSKFLLALAFLAAVGAGIGAMLWTSSASADINAGFTVTASVAETPALTGDPEAGDLVTYTFTIAGSSTGNTSGATITMALDGGDPGGTLGSNAFIVDYDASAGGPWQGTATTPDECTISNPPLELQCVDDDNAGDASPFAVADTITITAVIVPTNDSALSPPNCLVVDDGTGEATCTTSIPERTITQTVLGDGEVNAPGVEHTFTFALPVGFTCESDATENDFLRECDEIADLDVTDTGTSTTITGLTVDSDLNLPGEVTVSFVSDLQGSVEICLLLQFDPQDGDGFEAAVDPCATKTYSFLADGADEAVIRHRDMPDAATEDQAGSDPYCVTWLLGKIGPYQDVCGLLTAQDDVDDAIGSLHQACLINSTLTFSANDGDIEWEFAASAGNPTVSDLSTFPGPNDEPCVQWGSNNVGTQEITAFYNPDGPVAQRFYWDTDDDDNPDNGLTPRSLIKEWNTIDFTRIVQATGVVGATLADNTDELKLWGPGFRDCDSDSPQPPSGANDFCDRLNWDGQTVDVGGVIIPGTGFINAAPRSFIDYTFGGHSFPADRYFGPVDGASQTYTITAPCGSVRVENPTTGVSFLLVDDGVQGPGENGIDSADLLSSDKGVGFTFFPNAIGVPGTTPATGDCGPNAEICIDIVTDAPFDFGSPPAEDNILERVCVRFIVGPLAAKPVVLAWVGQRVVVEADWAVYPTGNRECPDYDGGIGDPDEFGVFYVKQANGVGAFVDQLVGNTNDVDIGTDSVLVDVDRGPTDGPPADGRTDPNSNCISRVIYESEEPGRVDINAVPADDNDSLSSVDPRGHEQDFVIYFMKLEDVTLGIVPELSETDAPDATAGDHPEPGGTPAQIFDNSDDVTAFTTNVSADVLTRVRVRGWVPATNCPVRDAGRDANNGFLPANRCIFPDDWRHIAGGATAESNRPNFDTLWGPGEAAPGGVLCLTEGTGAAGPFSLLDRAASALSPAVLFTPPIGSVPDAAVNKDYCNDTLAPHAGAKATSPATAPDTCGRGVTPFAPVAPVGAFAPNQCRNTTFPNNTITSMDAQMPPALVRFNLTGAGFLRGADKNAVYPGNSNPFYVTHIPAEPWISPTNSQYSGYQWNTWGAAGLKSGVYEYWVDLADRGPEVISCPTSDCVAPVGQGGFPLCPSPARVNRPVSTTYIVQSGDTLVTVARAFGTTPEAIAAANQMDVGDPLLVGQIIQIPASPTSAIGCRTGGYETISVYSDNHGEAMAWLNGDARLSFDGCVTSGNPLPFTPPHGEADIVLISGYYCPDGTPVGTSEVVAVVDYPDKKPHYALQTEPVTVSWTWGGVKGVTIEPGDTPQFNYVVFHVTDRDGFCSPSVSLHPVLGEQVNFMIDEEGGTIVAAELNGAPLPATQGQIVSTRTFDSDDPANADIVQPTLVAGECQAWVLVSASKLTATDVVVTAFDPEGTITFDIIINEPTPTPSPSPTEEPTASPTPATVTLIWGDSDCDGAVTTRDSQALLRRVLDQPELAQEEPCFGLGEDIEVVGANGHEWGDWDCDTVVSTRDSQAVLRDVLNQSALSQEDGCPAMGAEVQILI